MICDICGKSGVQVGCVSRSYGHGDDLFVVENVPNISCPRCGESYLTAETLLELERIKLHGQEWARERSVAVPSARAQGARLGWMGLFFLKRRREAAKEGEGRLPSPVSQATSRI